MKEITPQRFRCGLGQCPGLFVADDGRYVWRGDLANLITDEGRVGPSSYYEAEVYIDPKMIAEAIAAYESVIENE